MDLRVFGVEDVYMPASDDVVRAYKVILQAFFSGSFIRNSELEPEACFWPMLRIDIDLNTREKSVCLAL